MNVSLKKISLCSLIILCTSVAACDSFLGGDTNVDPNKVDKITLSAALPPILTNTSTTYYLLGYSISQITQNTSNYFASGPDIHDLIRLGSSWTNIYLDGLTNAHNLEQQAKDQNAPHYTGVAQVMMAMNLGLATDNWGPVPYSQALEGGSNIKPVFDAQQDIYNDIQSLLDSAIVNLQAPNSSKTPGSDDLIYSGDLSKWVKLAHAMKARYYIHLTKQDPGNAPDEALAEATQSFTSNDDDFQLVYNDRNFNPYYSNVALTNNTGNLYLTFSQQFIQALNGDTYGVFDPRLPIIADNGGAATYTGMVNGTGAGNNTDFTEQTYYSRMTAPIMMVTYSEIKFIEAEARFLQNGGTKTSVGSTQQAYDDYMEGIRAHMTKLGVSADSMNAYLSDPQVAVGASGLTLELIMKEKWIALFLNPESWTDMRRYDYSPKIYRDLTLPQNQNPQLNGKWIRRVSYPLDELNRNADNVNKVMEDMDVKMWWDKGGVDR